MKKTILVVACLALMFTRAANAIEVEQKWVYTTVNALLDGDVEKLTQLMKDAKAAGATHIQLGDYQFGFMGDMPPHYFENTKKICDTARELGLQIVPSIFPIGQSGRYLYNDPNLADGIPSKDVRFVVKNGVAAVDAALAPKIANAGFDEGEGDKPAGWRFEEPSGVTMLSLDTEVKHSGRASLKVTPPQGMRTRDGDRIGATQTVKVKPFHTWRLSVWVKTDGTRPSEHPVSIVGSSDKRLLTYQDFAIKATEDWSEHKIAFNSLDYSEVDVLVGSEPTSGTIWFDDISIEPAGLLNVLRRELVPLVVKSEDGKTTYVEGVDFKRVEDRSLGVAPSRGDFMVVSRGTYDVKHAPPSIVLTSNSRIKEGDVLLASFYSPTVLYDKQQVTVSISDPLVFDLMDEEMRRVSEAYGAKVYMMNYDEIRSAGWEDQPGGAHLTPAELLAKHATRAVEIIHKYVPDAKIFVWSDMFDPYHNARKLDEGKHYYFVNGSWEGSWEGLPSSVGIVNWIGRKESLDWFAGRGHVQIMSCSNDSGPVDRVARRLQTANSVKGVVGYMYTTWSASYGNMPAFFKFISTWTPSAEPAAGQQRPARTEGEVR